jgi:hypothetical protein
MKIQSLFLTLLYFQSILVFAQKKADVEPDYLNYKSGICYGTCPIINCTIKNDRKVNIDRIVFKKRDEIDTSKSGSFEGKLTDQEWKQLSMFLSSGSLTKNNFPRKDCCDNPMQTITIKRSMKISQFRSIFPQNKALPFIEFLQQVSLSYNYKKIAYDESLFDKLEVTYLKPKLHSSSEAQNNNQE